MLFSSTLLFPIGIGKLPLLVLPKINKAFLSKINYEKLITKNGNDMK